MASIYPVAPPVRWGPRKEFARWVGEAKREDTRVRRAAEAIEMLRAGRTRS